MTAGLYDHILFDLDGTLSDSSKGIYNAAAYMAEQLGLGTVTPEQFSDLIGPPLQLGLKRIYNLDGERNDLAVKIFRKYYSEKGIFENELYPGIFLLLNKLVEMGKNLYVATSKYEIYAKKVLQYFNILSFFTDIAGADYEGLKGGKETLILTLLQRNGIKDADRVVFVGDSKYDIEASGALGIDSVGVTYGFSSYDEIIQYDPDYLVENVDELRNLLISRE